MSTKIHKNKKTAIARATGRPRTSQDVHFVANRAAHLLKVSADIQKYTQIYKNVHLRPPPSFILSVMLCIISLYIDISFKLMVCLYICIYLCIFVYIFVYLCIFLYIRTYLQKMRRAICYKMSVSRSPGAACGSSYGRFCIFVIFR